VPGHVHLAHDVRSIACCAIEMMAVGMARFDMARFGFEVSGPRRASPTS
jgi:NADH:ubiquinone oxidoreductase subunit B-like Fe-S oxidoreductase